MALFFIGGSVLCLSASAALLIYVVEVLHRATDL